MSKIRQSYNGDVAAPTNIVQGNRSVPLQNNLVVFLHFALKQLKQESIEGPPMSCCRTTNIVRGNQSVPALQTSVQNNWLLLKKREIFEQESSVNEQRRRPDVDEDVIL